MQEAPVPANEARRIAVLHALGILDTPPEERFDRITRIASSLFDVPIALVSLVDVDRQWFKSCIGLDDSQTDRGVSFCAHALERADALVIEDALDDERFRDNPLVTAPPHIRFYAGHPLRPLEGLALGTLCVIDDKPRRFSDSDRALLADLAHLVEEQLASVDLARTSAALAESEARVAGILRSVAEAVATFSIDGTILSFNPSGEHMFRQSAAELIGRPITDLVAPADQDVVLGALATRAASELGEEVHVTVRGVRPDGSRFPIDVSASELEGSNGQVFIAVARDVSEIAALRERTRQIIEAAGDGICGIDVDGRITFANPAAAEMLGVDRASLTGRVLHPAFEGGVDAGEAQAVFVRSDGAPFTVEYTAAPLVDDGQVLGAVIVFSDISARVEVEGMKDQFVSVVSHELRTPLTSIQGSLGLVANGIVDRIDGEALDMVRIALSNTERLVRLVNDILDLERISTGGLDLDLATCDARALVDGAVQATSGSAASAGVTVDVDVDAREVVCDSDRLVQALTNLLGNAIKFSPDGGTVEVRTEHAEGATTFVVRDHGRGIPVDKLDSVFERFQQVDASDRREKGGTGLGLPITRSIARQHGGDVTVESTLGDGCTFRLTIPAASNG